jgi:hypothetical protein
MKAYHGDKKGSLEFLSGHAGACRLWRSPGNGQKGGYVTGHGGLSKKPSKALIFNGSGGAINMAQRLGFAVLSW